MRCRYYIFPQKGDTIIRYKHHMHSSFPQTYIDTSITCILFSPERKIHIFSVGKTNIARVKFSITCTKGKQCLECALYFTQSSLYLHHTLTRMGTHVCLSYITCLLWHDDGAHFQTKGSYQLPFVSRTSNCQRIIIVLVLLMVKSVTRFVVSNYTCHYFLSTMTYCRENIPSMPRYFPRGNGMKPVLQ